MSIRSLYLSSPTCLLGEVLTLDARYFGGAGHLCLPSKIHRRPPYFLSIVDSLSDQHSEGGRGANLQRRFRWKCALRPRSEGKVQARFSTGSPVTPLQPPWMRPSKNKRTRHISHLRSLAYSSPKFLDESSKGMILHSVVKCKVPKCYKAICMSVLCFPPQDATPVPYPSPTPLQLRQDGRLDEPRCDR